MFDRLIRIPPAQRHWLFGLVCLPIAALWLWGDGSEPLLSQITIGHYLFALVSSVAFLVLIPKLFGGNSHEWRDHLGCFLFTGSVGMLLLHGIHWFVEWSRRNTVSGALDASFVFHLARLIDQSRTIAHDYDAPFILRAIGCSLAIGLPEELVKILPVWFVIERRVSTAWRDALIVGLISGAAFGVAEGIVYSERQYNGTASLIIYLMRFVSCVGSHAAYAGIAALIVERRRVAIFQSESLLVVIVMLLVHISPIMLIHGLYDAFAYGDLFGWGVIADVATLVVLSVLVTRADSKEKISEDAADLARIRAKIARGGMDSLNEAEFATLRRTQRAARGANKSNR